MNILAFIHKNSSPDYHRLTVPLALMEDAKVLVTNQLDVEHFRDIDLFVYNRILPAKIVQQINELRDTYGFAIGVDVDDYWYLDTHHPFYQEYADADFGKLQVQQFRNADFVTVTHDRLATLVQHYNPDVYVVPNAIPKVGQFTPFTIEPTEHVRLFWQGSITHYPDIELIAPALQRLIGVPGLEMVLAGHVEGEPAWQHIAKLYTASGKLRHCLIGGMHHDAYYQAYREADICLVPLKNTTFNRLKSNLKVLEAANLGLPVIAHQVHPYRDMPLCYANGTIQWLDTIKYLVKHPAARQDAGERLREFCETYYNFDKINELRKQVYEHVCAQMD